MKLLLVFPLNYLKFEMPIWNRSIMQTDIRVEILGKFGALLSLMEIGLGSLLHAFHVPFGGHFMSLNQGYLLCRVSLQTSQRWMPYHVSNVAAVLKSLSPAGQKLGPMLSLSMQGLLFSIGTGIFGTNIIGFLVGMVLLSFWAFIQPLITYYLFFGQKLIDAADYLFKKTLPLHHLKLEYVMWIFLGIVLIKVLIAMSLAIIAWRSKGLSLNQDRLLQFTETKNRKMPPYSPLIMAFKDLTKPVFLVSLAGTALFLYYSQQDMAYLLRPIAIGFIFFYISRTMTLDKLLAKMENGRFQFFARGCKEALIQIRKVL